MALLVACLPIMHPLLHVRSALRTRKMQDGSDKAAGGHAMQPLTQDMAGKNVHEVDAEAVDSDS